MARFFEDFIGLMSLMALWLALIAWAGIAESLLG